MADDPNTPDAGQDSGGEPQVPQGARNPDAVANALAAERQAARDAREALRAAQEAAQQAQADAQAQAEAAAQAAQERDRAIREAAQIKAATQAGIPLEVAGRLQGTTPEELAADAAALKQTFAAQFAQPNPPSPADGLDGGARPSINQPTDPAQAFAADLAALSTQPGS